ncbi:MAG TPA: HAD-IA family hydrolase [Candidatus Saccharimonadales bacterium]|jgi:putative hydrolase of the HAD superfamily
MIKAVLFDNGGVLTEGGKGDGFTQIFADIYGIDAASVKLGQVGDFFRNAISADDFFAEMNRRNPGPIQATAAMFVEYAAPVFVRSEPVRNMETALRRADIRTGIISDAIAIIADEHKRRGDYDGFDPVLLSCEEGLAKPDVAIYERALAKLRLLAPEVLFIDDKDSCLLPARQLGMHTILAKSPEQIVRDVRRLLKTENNLEL